MIGRAVALVKANELGIVLIRNRPSEAADERLQRRHGGLKTPFAQHHGRGREGGVCEENEGEEGQDGRR